MLQRTLISLNIDTQLEQAHQQPDGHVDSRVGRQHSQTGEGEAKSRARTGRVS